MLQKKKPIASAAALLFLVFLVAACASPDDDLEVAADPRPPRGPRDSSDQPPVPGEHIHPRPWPSPACTAFPTVKAFVQIPRYGNWVFLDGDQVYWFEPVGEDHPGSTPPYTVFRAHINALQNRAAIVAGLSYPSAIQRVGDTLVWAEGNHSHSWTIHAMELDGTGLRELPAFADGPIGAIRAQDAEVYWAGWLEGNLGVASLAGGTSATVLADGVQWARDVAADESHIYLVDSRGLLRVPREGGDFELLSESADRPIRLLDDSIVSFAKGDLQIQPKNGGPPQLLVAGPVHWYEIIDDRLYLRAAGVLTRRSFAGGPIEILSTTSDELRMLGHDADCFYWYDWKAEEVWQIARRP